MIRNIIILFIFCSLTTTIFSQQGLTKLLPAKAKTTQSFIPGGWITLDSASGDFNKDGIKDFAFVLIDSVLERAMSYHRSVIILKGTASGFELSGVGDSAVLCLDCGGVFGDPYAGIEFKGSTLWISHFGGSAWKWGYTDKFQLRNGKWYLIGETYHSFWSVKECEKLNDFAGTNYKDTNFLTGDYEEKEISENCKLLKNKKGKEKVKPLVSLDKFIVFN